MPSSKNKRMASRQSRVRERRRRSGGRGRATALGAAAAGTREIRRGVWRTPDGGELASAGAPAAVEGVSEVRAAETVAASQSAAITRKRSARARTPSEPLPMYAHLGSELRRIAVLTALTAAALAVLTVFLR